MEHTKGEWEYDEELRARYSMVSGDNTVICGMPNPVSSGDKDQDALELEEMRANAHLISSAPDMYEALKEIREWLKSDDVVLKGRGLAEQFGIPKTMNKVDDALAKAEGK